MEKNDFYIDIVPVLVEEVFEEVGHALKRYVTAYHDVPGKTRWKSDEKETHRQLLPEIKGKERETATKMKERNEKMSEKDV